VTYIPVPIDTDPTDLADEAFTYLEEQVDGWLPSPGNLEAWLIESLAQIAGELRELAALVPDSIFEFYGSSILGLPPYEATQATGTTTWTAIDAAGYTVYAGMLVGVAPPSSTDTFAFEVVSDFTIPPGETVAAGITIRAIEAGAAASNLTGEVEMLDPLDFIDTVVLDGPTSGGVDAETTDAYLDRLSDLLTLLTPRPILPQDFATLAQRSIEGVARATAIDLYDPGPPVDANAPRCVTVAVVDANGNPCSTEVKQEVDDLLQSMREVNFLVFVVDPTYTTIDVTVDVVAYPGYQADEVTSRIEAALSDYLNPATWGVPPYGDTSGRSWINTPTVRWLEVSQAVNEVEGVHYISSLEIRAAGGSFGTSDVVMPGVAPLPEAGTFTVTAEEES
jgi:uncharacterized phage protein gp47/JayE